MAVPTITAITPAFGPVVGDNMVKVEGTNFQEPPAVPATGPVPDPAPTVRVTFGLDEATEVQVVSATELLVAVPPFRGPSVDGPLTSVDLTVENIDTSGVLIPGETVTQSSAYTYERPLLHGTSTKPTGGPSPYTLVAAALINAFRRQVLHNTTLTTHVDYSEDGVLEVQVSKIPAIVLQGPTITKDLEYWHNELEEVDIGGGINEVRRPPFIARAAFTIVGISDNEQESLNMQGAILEMFNVGKYLGVDLDPAVPDPDTRVHLVLQLTSPPATTTAPGEDNIRTFTAVCEVRGIEVRETEPVRREFTATDADLEAQHQDGTTTETIPIFP
jgi:hypothetical protein